MEIHLKPESHQAQPDELEDKDVLKVNEEFNPSSSKQHNDE